MITDYYKAAPILRTIATMLLMVIIGIKTTSVVVAAMGAKKDAAVIEKADVNEEKKAETDDKAEQDIETATLTQPVDHFLLPCATIKHHTAYFINYHLCFQKRIAIPPPDLA